MLSDYWVRFPTGGLLVYPQLGCVERENLAYMARGYQPKMSGARTFFDQKVGTRNGVPEEPQPTDGTDAKRGIEGEGGREGN